jgi:hypothetical protein
MEEENKLNKHEISEEPCIGQHVLTWNYDGLTYKGKLSYCVSVVDNFVVRLSSLDDSVFT